MSEFVRTSEVARILDVHPRTVIRWCKDGVLKYTIINTRYYIKRDSLEKYLYGKKRK